MRRGVELRGRGLGGGEVFGGTEGGLGGGACGDGGDGDGGMGMMGIQTNLGLEIIGFDISMGNQLKALIMVYWEPLQG